MPRQYFFFRPEGHARLGRLVAVLFAVLAFASSSHSQTNDTQLKGLQGLMSTAQDGKPVSAYSKWAWRAQFQNALINDPATASFVSRAAFDPIGASDEESDAKFWKKVGEAGDYLPGGPLVAQLAALAVGPGMTQGQIDAAKRKSLSLLVSSPGEFDALADNARRVLSENPSNLSNSDAQFRKVLMTLVDDNKFLPPNASMDVLLSKVPPGAGLDKGLGIIASLTEDQKKEIRGDISNLKKYISDEQVKAAADQSEVLAFMKEQVETQKNAQEMALAVSNYRAGVSLVQTLISFKDPDAAAFVANVGNNIIDAGVCISNLQKAVDLTSINGLVTSVIGLSGILGAQSDPASERHKQVMDTLGTIKDELGAIRKQLNLIDVRLLGIQKSLDALTDVSTASFSSISSQLSMMRADGFYWASRDIASVLSNFRDDLAKVEAKCFANLRERPNLIRNQYQAYGYYVADCISESLNLVVRSADPKMVLTPDDSRISLDDVATSSIYDHWDDELRADQLIGLLPQIESVMSSSGTTIYKWPTIVHPALWLRSVSAYLGTRYSVREYDYPNQNSDIDQMENTAIALKQRISALNASKLLQTAAYKYVGLTRSVSIDRLQQAQQLLLNGPARVPSIIPLTAFIVPLKQQQNPESWLKERLAAMICGFDGVDSQQYCEQGAGKVTQNDLLFARLAIGNYTYEYAPLTTRWDVTLRERKNGPCPIEYVPDPNQQLLIKVRIGEVIDHPDRAVICHTYLFDANSPCNSGRLTYYDASHDVLGTEDFTSCLSSPQSVEEEPVGIDVPNDSSHLQLRFSREQDKLRETMLASVQNEHFDFVKSRDQSAIAKFKVYDPKVNETFSWLMQQRSEISSKITDREFTTVRGEINKYYSVAAVSMITKLGDCLNLESPPRVLMESMSPAEIQKTNLGFDLGQMPSSDQLKQLLLTSNDLDEAAINQGKFELGLPEANLVGAALTDINGNPAYGECQNFESRFNKGLHILQTFEETRQLD